MAKQIDSKNYEILDLIRKGGHSSLFIENYKGMSNEDYLLQSKFPKDFYIDIQDEIQKKPQLLQSLLDHKLKHPFEGIFLYTLSVKDLRDNKNTYDSTKLDNLICSIKSINNKKNIDVPLTETENFIELKLLFFEKLTKNPFPFISNFSELKYNLECFETKKIVTEEGVNSLINKSPNKKSFLDILDIFLDDFFDNAKKNFKKELFKVDFENNYFDSAIQSLLENYRELEKKIFNEKNSYFAPATKLFRLKYINLFQWIISNFSFYLDKEMKRKLEIEIFPRDYIPTFKITKIKNIHLKVLTNINKLSSRLIEKGYIDKEDSERFKTLFKEKNRIDGLINWKKNIGTLFTFIKMLSDEGIIESTNIWEITARYVKVQNVPISTKKLRDSKYSKATKTISELQGIIECLNK
ncbi:MAG: hypothetical protein KGV44_07945 [Flavobacteriaceae bacterium]|nr:hypothetical protein [Flavobacteriaceae bacterium]